jgi:hypothetical protein
VRKARLVEFCWLLKKQRVKRVSFETSFVCVDCTPFSTNIVHWAIYVIYNNNIKYVRVVAGAL